MAHTLMRDRKKEEPGASREEEKEVNVCDGGTLGKIQPARAIVEVMNFHRDVSERDRFEWLYTANCKFSPVWFFFFIIINLFNYLFYCISNV